MSKILAEFDDEDAEEELKMKGTIIVTQRDK